MPVKALSLWQPWATLVVSGAKQFETRSWSVGYRGRLLIHASKRKDEESLDLCLEEPFRLALVTAGLKVIGDLPFGALIGEVELAGCWRTEEVWFANSPDVAIILWGGGIQIPATERPFGDYSRGRWAWRLRNPKPFSQPIPYLGRTGLFDVPAEALEGK